MSKGCIVLFLGVVNVRVCTGTDGCGEGGEGVYRG